MDPIAILEDLTAIVHDIANRYDERLVEEAARRHFGELENPRHGDNFLSEIDLELHTEYRKRLAEFLPSFLFVSEEGKPETVGSDAHPDLAVIVDPLDASELAVRGLNAYTNVQVCSVAEKRPIVTVVGDLFHPARLFAAVRRADGSETAYVETRSGKRFTLTPSTETDIRAAVISNNLIKPHDRFSELAGRGHLLDELGAPSADGVRRGRILSTSGSIALCHVAAGFTDATFETAKGYKLWDLQPGLHVLLAAGGTAIDLEGNPLTLDTDFDDPAGIATMSERRRMFIAAGTDDLARAILAKMADVP